VGPASCAPGTLPCSLVAVAREPERGRESMCLQVIHFPLHWVTPATARLGRERTKAHSTSVSALQGCCIFSPLPLSLASRVSLTTHTPPFSLLVPSIFSLAHTHTLLSFVFSCSVCILSLCPSACFVTRFCATSFLAFFWTSPLALLACSRSRPTVCLRWTWMV